jgi:hypothetical protein
MAQTNHDKQSRALRLLQRKQGATVEHLTKVLKLKDVKAARGIIDRLRVKEEPIENIASHTFKLKTRRNPKST